MFARYVRVICVYRQSAFCGYWTVSVENSGAQVAFHFIEARRNGRTLGRFHRLALDGLRGAREAQAIIASPAFFALGALGIHFNRDRKHWRFSLLAGEF
jgi:hypothetical protein